jgi:hypothetical protein
MNFLLFFSFISYFFLYFVNSRPLASVSNSRVYWYEDWKRLHKVDHLSISTTTEIPGIIECFGNRPKPETTTQLEKMEQFLKNNPQLPSPCNISPSEQDTQTKFYCFALLALWVMLMLSAVIYQIRTLLSVKTLGLKKKEQKDAETQTNDAKI